MEPKIVRVGNHFINLSTLLWAEVRTSSDTNRQTIALVYGAREGNQRFVLQVNYPDSEKIIRYLESNSEDLRD